MSGFDVLVKRSNDKFVSTVFRKKNILNVFNFQSHFGLKRKINLIRTLCYRTNLVCSPDFFEEEFKYSHLSHLYALMTLRTLVLLRNLEF